MDSQTSGTSKNVRDTQQHRWAENQSGNSQEGKTMDTSLTEKNRIKQRYDVNLKAEVSLEEKPRASMPANKPERKRCVFTF